MEAEGLILLALLAFIGGLSFGRIWEAENTDADCTELGQFHGTKGKVFVCTLKDQK